MPKPGVSPSILFLAGLLLAPAFLLQRRLEIKALQTLFLFGLCAAADPLSLPRSAAASGIFLAVTVAFNLLTPMGRVLARIGPFAVTELALAAGLDRALTLIGLLYLSRFFVHRSLRFPGAAGAYLSRTLYFLNCLFRHRPKITLRRLVPALDGVFASVYGKGEPRRPVTGVRNMPESLALLCALLALNYGLLFSG